ncbi:MAG: DinB family protein [Holophagaceae bacterium]|nr:DinB family protein [Holophagaceae bacterium]
MSELANLVDEIQEMAHGHPWHGLSLAEILSDLSAEEATAKPFPGVHSIRELILHIAGWQEVFFIRLQGEMASEPPEGDFPAEPADWPASLAKFEDSNRRLLAVVSGFSDASLDAKVAGKDYTVGFMLHGLVSHCVYHSGQISLLKKALRS